jgi:hypothetical protein
MPSYLHETLIEMFRDRPAFAADLLAGPLGVRVPAFRQAHLSSGDLTAMTPTEYRADAVVTLTNGKRAVLAVVVEVQLGTDSRKRRTWPAYVANLHARLNIPVMLLVVCPSPTVATWCAARIVVSEPGLVLTPVVIGPNEVPYVTDLTVARCQPELAVLSALAHGAEAGQSGVFEALLAALNVVDLDHANLYADVVLTALPAAAREYLEAFMIALTHGYQSDFARRFFADGEAKGEAKGVAKGKAAAVLAVLQARGVEVGGADRAQIIGCEDHEQLDSWVLQAATATTIHDVLDRSPS